MKPERTVKTYIYCLVDPIIRMPIYVGCTKHPVRRLDTHIYNSLNDKGAKKLDCAIGEILDADQLPYMEVLEECDHKDSEQREKLWIRRFRTWGIPILNVEFSSDLIDKRRVFVKRDNMIDLTEAESMAALSSHQDGDWAEIGKLCGCHPWTVRSGIKSKRINKTVWNIVCEYFKMGRVA